MRSNQETYFLALRNHYQCTIQIPFINMTTRVEDVNLEQVGNERHTNSVVDGALTSRCVENICWVRVSQDKWMWMTKYERFCFYVWRSTGSPCCWSLLNSRGQPASASCRRSPIRDDCCDQLDNFLPLLLQLHFVFRFDGRPGRMAPHFHQVSLCRKLQLGLSPKSKHFIRSPEYLWTFSSSKFIIT